MNGEGNATFFFTGKRKLGWRIFRMEGKRAASEQFQVADKRKARITGLKSRNYFSARGTLWNCQNSGSSGEM